MGWGSNGVRHYAEQIERSNDLFLLEEGARLIGLFKDSLEYDLNDSLKDCPKLAVLILEMKSEGGNKRADPRRGLICQIAYASKPDPIGALAQCLIKEDGHC